MFCLLLFCIREFSFGFFFKGVKLFVIGVFCFKVLGLFNIVVVVVLVVVNVGLKILGLGVLFLVFFFFLGFLVFKLSFKYDLKFFIDGFFLWKFFISLVLIGLCCCVFRFGEENFFNILELVVVVICCFLNLILFGKEF